MTPLDFTPEELERGRLVDRLQVAMSKRAVIRERIHTGGIPPLEAAHHLGEARAAVDEAEMELAEFDIQHPCNRHRP